MPERLRKFGLYFRDANAYWQLAAADPGSATESGKLGNYPLQLGPRLSEGHFCDFDGHGLPVRRDPLGDGFVHNYTTLCAFALAHWERYLATDDDAHLSKLLRVADYIIFTSDRAEGMFRLRSEKPPSGHCGRLSVNNQGEAISVLCRAWQATGKEHYLQAALKCVPPFKVTIENDGLLSRIEPLGITWFEEYPFDARLNHVLNGMIYGLWGLHDLVQVTGDQTAQELWDAGVDSVLKALPLFDSGYWSYYCLPASGEYVASMMYHNLHVCQLTVLARQTGIKEFATYAGLFESYATSAAGRLRAGAKLFYRKYLNAS